MSSCWRRGRWAAAFLAIPLAVPAGPYADLNAHLKAAKDTEVVAALRAKAKDDPDAASALDDGAKAARAYIRLRATLEGAKSFGASPTITAPEDDGRVEGSWLARALKHLRWNRKPQSSPNVGFGGGIGSWATTIVWVVLGGLGVFAIAVLARHVQFAPRRRKKALVDEEEPLRSADAWLEEANALIREGRFREAVRGLYVAGLMRLDEAGVMRFERHETNWEHLRRFEHSPRKPDGLELRAATQRFDRVWYGRMEADATDAHALRDWYDDVVRHLTPVDA